MSIFEEVCEKYEKLPYMDEVRAVFIKDFILENNIKNVLELGFFHGKSSTLIASVLADRGSVGNITTIDRRGVEKLSPNIYDLAKEFNVMDRITPIISQRSYTWELLKLIKNSPPKFDFCYLDGGHTWDVTGFGLLLVDMLLKPGGFIIFDDLDWSIEGHLKLHPDSKQYSDYSSDEISAKGVRLVFETITPYLGYTDFIEVKKFGWGIARKNNI
jgi:predicted O-methyltransferase YrrM